MTLETYQRGLLDLVKNRGGCPDDAYLRRVAASPALGMLREIAVWWRAFVLEAQCRFTSRLLKRLGCFDESVASYFNDRPTSPFAEELSEDFLLTLATHDDGLVRAVSQFERAFLRARAGSAEICEVQWDRHPDLVFAALDNGAELPPAEPDCVYRMMIQRDLPGMVVCTRERLEPAITTRGTASL
jgi:hypothetical protein